jgi:hypothetical protein
LLYLHRIVVLLLKVASFVVELIVVEQIIMLVFELVAFHLK